MLEKLAKMTEEEIHKEEDLSKEEEENLAKKRKTGQGKEREQSRPKKQTRHAKGGVQSHAEKRSREEIPEEGGIQSKRSRGVPEDHPDTDMDSRSSGSSDSSIGSGSNGNQTNSKRGREEEATESSQIIRSSGESREEITRDVVTSMQHRNNTGVMVDLITDEEWLKEKETIRESKVPMIKNTWMEPKACNAGMRRSGAHRRILHV